ncbi:MAG: hypothetical protein H7A47_01375 [Verrucomicrobiales bacterium]|nr:hypothetical protein [Verrucomicrobiales bacterium]
MQGATVPKSAARRRDHDSELAARGTQRGGGRRLILPLCICAASLRFHPGAALALSLGADPAIDPGRFKITEFVSGLSFPYSMQSMADGSVLVATSPPVAPGGSLFSSTVEILRFVDADNNGVADGPGQSVFSAPAPGPATAIRFAGDHLLVATGPSILVLGRDAGAGLSFSQVGAVNFSFPAPWSHRFLTLGVRPSPGNPAARDVFFNVGARYNSLATVDTISATGLLNASGLAADSVYKFTLTPGGAGVAAVDLIQIASGLRNAFGLAFEPSTGDLWLTDNGFDGLLDPSEPVSADELNRIAAADIGTALPDFGFPDSYIEYRTGNQVGDPAAAPLLAIQPIPAPDGKESEGAADLAFSPMGFPAGLNDGLFIAFHGRTGTTGVDNEENGVLFFDPDTGEYFEFLRGQQSGLGYPDSLLATDDALFVADLASAGGLSGAPSGRIWKITAIPEPAGTVPLTGLVLLGLLAWRRHRPDAH